MTVETDNIRHREDLRRRVIEVDLESDLPYEGGVFDEYARMVGNTVKPDSNMEYSGLKYIVLGGKLYAFHNRMNHSEVTNHLSQDVPGELLSAGQIAVVHYRGHDKRVIYGRSMTLDLSSKVSDEFRDTTLRSKLGHLFDIDVRFDFDDTKRFFREVDAQINSQ